jgi:hypothetical protein
MRKTIGVVAVLVLFGYGSEARSAGWPSWWPFSGQRSCATGTCGSVYDDSPLMPQLTHWTFQKSNCRLPACSGLDFHRGEGGETPSFPPLPYSHRAFEANAQRPLQGSHTFP